MGKLLRQKLVQEAVVQSEFKDLWNEFHSFKRQMANVCQKYDTNFWETEAAERVVHHGFIAHEAAISLINEHCLCGKDVETESLSYGTPISSPSPLGTPILPEPVPIQVAPQFQVGWVTRLSFGEANDLSILDVTSPRRGSSP